MEVECYGQKNSVHIDGLFLPLKYVGIGNMKSLVCACAFVLCSSSLACSFTSSESPKTRQIVEANGGYPISDTQCKFMNDNRVLLRVQGEAAVVTGGSVGWASVTLEDESNGITSKLSGRGTYVNVRDAAEPVANRLFISALKGAVSTLDFEAAVQEIDAQRAKLAMGTGARKK